MIPAALRVPFTAIRSAPPQSLAAWFLLAAAVLHAPLLFLDLLYAHDGGFHHMNARLFTAGQTWDGLWPRWLPEAQNGYGSPIFLYYSPLLYMVYAFLERMTFGLLPAHVVLGLTMMLFSGGLGLTTYLWCREYLARGWAIAAALVFMAAPYHLCINLAIRGALPEVAALTWMPLVFLAAKQLAESGPSRAAWPWALMAALSYAGLIYTHVLIAYMAIPFVAVVIAGHAWFTHQAWRPTFLCMTWAGGAFALGALLAAPLLLPFFTLLDLITPVWWWDNDYIASKHWIPFAFWGWHGIFLTFMTLISLVALFFFVLTAEFALLPFFSRRRLSRKGLLWLALCIFAGLLILALPRFLWAEGSPFASAQFPYRYLTLFEFLCLSLGVCVLRDLGPRSTLWMRMLGIRIAIIGAGAILTAWALIAYYNDRDLEENRKLSLATNWQSNEYLPGAITGSYEAAGEVERRLRRNEAPPLLRLENAAGTARLVRRHGSRFLFDVDSPGPTVLHVRQFAFPGWKAANMEDGSPLPLSAAGENRTLAIALRQGRTRIRLYREALPQEIYGWILAALSAMVLAGVSLRHYGWRRPMGRGTDQL